MRNCFVLGCDNAHRDNPKRAMFNIPKDPEKFEKWREALPKHRELKLHDRVCEKHFRPSDILRDWTHTINGLTTVLPRKKPTLLPSAVPLPEESLKRKPKQIASQGTKAPAKEQRIPSVEREDPVEKQIQVIEISIGAPDEGEEEHIEPVEIEEAPEISPVFEELYTNVYAVELPSSLWGIHRDPKRKYVAFTRFDWESGGGDESAVDRTTVLIEETARIRVWHRGELALDCDAPELLPIASLLEKIEESISRGDNPVELWLDDIELTFD
ncbi:hypothetical protein AND_006322 [Anopheles darlingi]|uniref:THAP-type domain-containing protein n=1 Tax=Anopheles darlingi TaxID=43151 RepID=W5JGT9_ANODA|nr:hypothetical protein AND_006322 [Anopheles darlingi]